jgi:glyoxylase-like metal-dependent hydrolase (beta-lactamase superfamily II)
MTFDGTNSWVLHEPGRRGSVIVDPGPDDPRHLSALVQLALEAGGRVDAILLTHGHPDHSAGVRATDPHARLELALAARQARLTQVEGAVRDGCRTVRALADQLYGGFDERIRRAIEATVRAHLRYLHDHDRLRWPVEIDG